MSDNPAKPDQTTSGSDTVSSAAASANYRDDIDVRTTPGLIDFLKPNHLARWCWGLIEGWFLSRPYARLAVGIPFLFVAIIGTGFVWWLRSSPKDSVVQHYEAAIDRATEEQNDERVGLYLRGLTALRPNNNAYAFRMAVHELKTGNENRARNVLSRLTGPDGYLPAREWLVEQSVKPDPDIPLTDAQLEGQLLLILRKRPTDLRSNQVLADLYLRQGQLKQAEDRLLKIVNDVPALGLPLARIQKRLNRDAEPIERHLSLAEDFFQEQLLQNRHNVRARAARAEALTELGRPDDAVKMLEEGLELDDATEQDELKTVLANVYARTAAQQLAASSLNRESSVRLLTKALQIDPTNRQSLQQALILWQTGSTFPQDTFKTSIEHLRATRSAEPEDRLLLSQTLAAAGHVEESIGILKPLSDETPRLKLTLVRLLKSINRTGEANKLIDQLTQNYITNRDDNDTSLNASLFRAEILQLAGRHSECVSELENNRPAPDGESTVANRLRWAQMYGRVKLAAFDRKQRDSSFSNPGEAVELLNQALSTGTVTVPVVTRLAELTYRDDEFAEPADEALNRLLAAGQSTRLLYNLLGTQALQRDRFSKAIRYLQRAHSLNRNDPMVMNNLALANVRGSSGDSRRALQLINDALEIIPEHPDALSTRGEIYVAMEQWEQARTDLEKALVQRQDSRTVRKLLARVFDELGENGIANEHRRILESLTE